MNKPESPWVLIGLGFLIAALGGFFFAVASAVAPVVMGALAVGTFAVAATMVTAGAVGVGVERGMARHAWTHRR